MKIILYKSDTCPQCKVLKMKLDKKGIPYVEEKDVRVMTELGIHTIPQLEVDGVRYTSLKAANEWINAFEVNG